MLEILLKIIVVLAVGWLTLIVAGVCSEVAESRRDHHRDKISPFGREDEL